MEVTMTKLKLMMLSLCVFGGMAALMADPEEKSEPKSEAVTAADDKSADTKEASKDTAQEDQSSCTKS
jgi:hypothetical protein